MSLRVEKLVLNREIRSCLHHCEHKCKVIRQKGVVPSLFPSIKGDSELGSQRFVNLDCPAVLNAPFMGESIAIHQKYNCDQYSSINGNGLNGNFKEAEREYIDQFIPGRNGNGKNNHSE